MRIIFQTGRQQATWNLPMVKKKDEDAIVDWAERNKGKAEDGNGMAQLARLVNEIIKG